MAEDRMHLFKNMGKDSEELRRRRNDVTVELRKSRKDEQLAKRRNIVDVGDEELSESELISKNCDDQNPPVDHNSEVSSIALGKIAADIFSGDARQEFIGCQMARKIISRRRNPPIDSIIQAGIVPKCIELLKSPNSDTQLEVAWIVTNIASGNSSQTNYLINEGVVDPLIELLRSKHTHLVEQAVWALGNIAGDGPEQRDMLINKGFVPPLVSLAKSQGSITFLRNIAWTMSNLCRDKQPSPPISAVRQMLPALSRLINMEDLEIISNGCWALSYLTDGPNEKIVEVLKAGVVVVSRVAELLNRTELCIVTPCLRTIGNIVSGNDQQADRVLSAGPVIQALRRLLKSPKVNISKEAAWAISNLAAGTVHQINAIISGGLVPILIDIMHNGELKTKREACWAITNITCGGCLDHNVYLRQCGVVPAFCDMLKCKDSRSVLLALDGLENILKSAIGYGDLGKLHEEIAECGGLDSLDELQTHENVAIYSMAYSIVDNYLADDDDVNVDSRVNEIEMVPPPPAPINEDTVDFQMHDPPPPKKAGYDF